MEVGAEGETDDLRDPSESIKVVAQEVQNAGRRHHVGTGYLETESGFTIFYADSKMTIARILSPCLSLPTSFTITTTMRLRSTKSFSGGMRSGLEEFALYLPTPTPASGATPATQTGKILSKALSNEDLEKIGNKLAQDFVKEDWSDTEKIKTSAKSTPKVGAVGSTNKAGITTANSPFATNTPQQSTLIKAAKPTHTSSGSEAVPIDFDKGGDSSVRKRVVKGKPDVDEGDEDDSDREEKRRTPASATPTAPEKEKKPRKKRTSKGKTKD
ncbi:hypothetical protein BGZ88_010292 [Linnemannia elongata]|nr:hypothetical protein BGZ88_010292 [Linnemannia elongata]